MVLNGRRVVGEGETTVDQTDIRGSEPQDLIRRAGWMFCGGRTLLVGVSLARGRKGAVRHLPGVRVADDSAAGTFLCVRIPRGLCCGIHGFCGGSMVLGSMCWWGRSGLVNFAVPGGTESGSAGTQPDKGSSGQGGRMFRQLGATGFQAFFRHILLSCLSSKNPSHQRAARSFRQGSFPGPEVV